MPGLGKVYLCKDQAVLVSRYHLNCVVGKMERLGLFVADNTAGFDGLLHRVGVMRDKVDTRLDHITWNHVVVPGMLHTSRFSYVLKQPTDEMQMLRWKKSLFPGRVDTAQSVID